MFGRSIFCSKSGANLHHASSCLHWGRWSSRFAAASRRKAEATSTTSIWTSRRSDRLYVAFFTLRQSLLAPLKIDRVWFGRIRWIEEIFLPLLLLILRQSSCTGPFTAASSTAIWCGRPRAWWCGCGVSWGCGSRVPVACIQARIYNRTCSCIRCPSSAEQLLPSLFVFALLFLTLFGCLCLALLRCKFLCLGVFLI
jgi:hypothetical protein